MTSELKALREIITSSLDKIIDTCESRDKQFPSLNDPIGPEEFTPEGIRNDPIVSKNIGLAVAAAFQLIATLQSPPTTLTIAAFRATLPTALGIVEAANVAEIIRPAGPHGMHVKDIAAECTDPIDPRKLARVLRFLATNHWFKEVAPDTFAHNLLSSLLDTKKDHTVPLFNETKHKSSSGLAAIVGFGADEVTKSLSHLKDTLLSPQTSLSEEVGESAYQRAINTSLDKWAYYDSGGSDDSGFDGKDGNVGGDKLARYRRDRFASAMSGASKLHPPQAVVTSFDWETVRNGGVVVDVGGGKGHVSVEVAKVYPHLRFVVEDRPEVVREAQAYWNQHLPAFVHEGKVEFIGVDFFEPQPPFASLSETEAQHPDVFLLRQITHDWSDKYCINLLKNLRLIAGPQTKLVVIDSIMQYACPVSGLSSSSDGDGDTLVLMMRKTKGEEKEEAPKPLLPNMGGANLLSYTVDNLIMSTLNAGERTLGAFMAVFVASGWKLVEVRKNPGSEVWWPSLICVPA